MKQSHLATAAFWVGLLTLFGWQASAQIPRPPMPIPNRSRPHAANRTPDAVNADPDPAATPAVIPIPPQRPTPPPTPVMLPVLSHVALPPAEYDRPYTGRLTVLKEDSYLLIRHVCNDTPNPVACSFRTYDTVSGETLSCLILLGPKVHNDERALRHEIGHCNGWGGDHPGARYD